MGLRGPQRIPTAILEARGSRRVGERAGEPRLPVEKPSCPAFLKGEARKEWARVTRELVRMGVLAKCDRALLATYCVYWAELVELAALARDEQLTAKARWRLGIQLQRTVEMMVKLADRFGFSPAARARLAVQVREWRAEDPKLRFFQE